MDLTKQPIDSNHEPLAAIPSLHRYLLCLATCLGLTRITIALQNSNPAIIMDVNSPFLWINQAL